MIATALHRFSLPRVTRPAILRGLAAGGAWALIMAAGFTAWSAWQCGGVCLEYVTVISGLSLAAGILGIGPVAAFGHKSS